MYDSKDYTLGWICALETEFLAAQVFLDEEHEEPAYLAPADDNVYKLGRMGRHNVVITILPTREYGKSSAAVVANHMKHSFPSVRVGLMVGIGGGAPSIKNDIKLGDIVVSSRQGGNGGVVQYDYGKAVQGCDFAITGHLHQSPTSLAKAVTAIKAEYDRKGNRIFDNVYNAVNKINNKGKYCRPSDTSDRLYRSSFTHPLDKLGEDCSLVCGDDASNLIARAERREKYGTPVIHYGLIASADTVMKDAITRDKWAAKENILCFEMETAGLMNHFPCIVIRGYVTMLILIKINGGRDMQPW